MRADSCDVSTVIVTYNSAADLPACLQSVSADSDIVIVDNASVDSSVERARSVRPAAKVIENRINVGFGAACNQAAQKAKGPWLLFLNPDAKLTPATLGALTDAAIQHGGGLIGAAQFDDQGRPRASVMRPITARRIALRLLPFATRWCPSSQRLHVSLSDPIYHLGGPVAQVSGSCMLILKADFERAGCFDERFFLYAEEQDLADRVRAGGGQCVYAPRAHVTHRAGASTGHESRVSTFHLYRSHTMYWLKYRGRWQGSAAAGLVGAALLVKAATTMLKNAFGRTTPGELARVVYGLQGIADGLCGTRRTAAISQTSMRSERGSDSP